ncbi:MAG: error-prone DNA polymerase [Sandaracinaceae bacterium]|nr:error-prone DNA polymerase [Sandaracinaceae bacterium]
MVASSTTTSRDPRGAGYVPLWVKSHYSFLEGASSPEELVEQAHALGLGALAMTDRDGVYGLVKAHFAARERGLRLIAGAELTLTGVGSPDASRATSAGALASMNHPTRVVALAHDREGYAQLCRLISVGQGRAPKGQSQLAAHELAALTHCELLCADPALLAALRPLPVRVSAYCVRHLLAEEREPERRLRIEAQALGLPVVGGFEVLYHHVKQRPLQDVVACVRAGVTLSAAGTVIRSNAEHALLSPLVAQQRFADAPELLRRSLDVAERCAFTLDQLDYRYPEEPRPEGVSTQSWLRTLTYEGAAQRYPEGVPADVRVQLERELCVIEDLQYGGYFLTMHEIVAYCRSQRILCQGRGSAANSAVCFCLGITAVDPVRMDLLFERFLSRERAEPPDIDLDIEHERREEVIQHVYEKYGRKHAAMVANVVRYRTRSAVREVGKVLGIPATDLDAVAKLVRHHDDLLDDQLLKDAGLPMDAQSTRQLCGLALMLQDTPRHLSVHPGGFLLGDQPVDTLVPVEPATMPGRTVIQWDKYDVEALGLFKVDLLGLGALTCLRIALDLLREHRDPAQTGPHLELRTLPAEDPATYAMVARGDTLGVFQIESRAQMAMLPRLKPRCFYDLVIEVAIVRPGPIQGDMVHPYLRRRSGQETVEYPHPTLERVLKKTLGVPIFQEQVMKLAVLAADYTPGEADQLRRDMAAWRKEGRIEAHHQRMVPRMIEKGIAEEFAERVFAQIRGFGEYGFPESHAASFALLSYATAWLRCHHPSVFLCALLNAQPMGFYQPATLVDDARRRGVVVRPISVLQSAWDCTLEGMIEGVIAPPVRMGLRYVTGLGVVERERIEAAWRDGPFTDLEDFTRRTALPTRQLVRLAQAGAFDDFGLERRDAIWAARALARFRHDTLPLASAATQLHFASLDGAERISWDYRASRHSTAGHPILRLRPHLTQQGLPSACELSALPHGKRVDYVGLVICRQRPGTASGVTFFTLEDETGFVNAVLYRDAFERQRTLAKTSVLLGMSGVLQVVDGVTHLLVQKLFAPRLPVLEELPRSRDFH